MATIPASTSAFTQDPLATDKRYKLLEAAMRKHGYQAHALIEALHTAQEAFGFLDDFTLRHVARALRLPPSKVYGVATFYNHFTLKPQGAHTCVVCTGTACYIKGAQRLLAAVEREWRIKPGGTTADNALSLLQARCFGSCAAAPVYSMDGAIRGGATDQALVDDVRHSLKAAAQPEKAVDA